MSFHRRYASAAIAATLLFCTLVSSAAFLLQCRVDVNRHRDVASASCVFATVPDFAPVVSLSQALQSEPESANTKLDKSWSASARAFASRLRNETRHVVAVRRLLRKSNTLLGLGTSLRL